jgi:hypothetical protein
MKRGRWADHPETLREHSRLGVIRAATLESLGMKKSTIYRRCLPDGPWRRLLPGIIMMENSSPSDDQRATAAMLFSGPRAVITGTHACLRHGLQRSELPNDNSIHMLVPHEHKLLSSEYVTIERTIRLPRAVTLRGFPLAPLVRATLDSARRVRTEDPAVKLLIEAVQLGGCSPKELMVELNLGGQRGTAMPRRILGGITEIRSIAEFHGRRIGKQLTVGPSHWNAKLYDRQGQYVAQPDAWWDEVALAWEIDSLAFHYKAAGYARTLQRNNRYAAAGIAVVQTLPSDLLKNPAGVVAELEAAYRAAAIRTRPPVRIAPEAA